MNLPREFMLAFREVMGGPYDDERADEYCLNIGRIITALEDSGMEIVPKRTTEAQHSKLPTFEEIEAAE